MNLILLKIPFILVFAGLNRAAGSDLFGLKDRLGLKGKPMLWVAPFVDLLALCWVPYDQAGAWTAAYLFWRMWEHGRWIDLENDPTDPHRQGKKMTLFEQVITSISLGRDLIALFWRHLTIWPGLVLVWYFGGSIFLVVFGPVVAALLAGSHYIAKQICFQREYHWLAESLHGAIVGLLIVGGASC